MPEQSWSADFILLCEMTILQEEDGVVCLDDDDDEEVVCLGEEEEIVDKLVQVNK